MYIVTFHLRGSWAGDGINAFRHRVGEILDKIDQEAPDVIATRANAECAESCTA